MKKIIFSGTCFFFLINLNGQIGDQPTDGGSIKTPEADETHAYWGAGAAYYFLPIASLNAELETRGINVGFKDAQGFGIDYGYNTISSRLDHGVTGLLSFHYLLPQHVSAKNDSIKVSLNGYNAQFDLLGANFLKLDFATLTGGLGWAFGRLKVTEDVFGGKSTYLNKYFAAEGRFEFNVRLADHFYIGVRYAYRADLTKTRWTRTGESSADLPGTNMSGTMLGAFIGYGK